MFIAFASDHKPGALEKDLQIIFKGPLHLFRDPVTDLEVSTKKYFDAQLNAKITALWNAHTFAASSFPATTGDFTSPKGSAVLSLKNVVTAGKYSAVKYDVKGRVVGGDAFTTIGKDVIKRIPWSSVAWSRTGAKNYSIYDFVRSTTPVNFIHLTTKIHLTKALKISSTTVSGNYILNERQIDASIQSLFSALIPKSFSATRALQSPASLPMMARSMSLPTESVGFNDVCEEKLYIDSFFNDIVVPAVSFKYGKDIVFVDSKGTYLATFKNGHVMDLTLVEGASFPEELDGKANVFYRGEMIYLVPETITTSDSRVKIYCRDRHASLDEAWEVAGELPWSIVGGCCAFITNEFLYIVTNDMDRSTKAVFQADGSITNWQTLFNSNISVDPTVGSDAVVVGDRVYRVEGVSASRVLSLPRNPSDLTEDSVLSLANIDSYGNLVSDWQRVTDSGVTGEAVRKFVRFDNLVLLVELRPNAITNDGTETVRVLRAEIGTDKILGEFVEVVPETKRVSKANTYKLSVVVTEGRLNIVTSSAVYVVKLES